MNKQKPMPGFKFKIMTFIMSIRKMFRNINEEVNLVGIKPGDYILDFGCGLGFNTIPSAQKVGNKGKVFALDINSKAIKIIKEKEKKYNLNNIKTILSDCKTRLKNKSIDIVYLHNTLPIVENKKSVLNEIHRILKINGKLSYMSRTFSRLAGENSMTDKKLKEYLETKNRFKLIKTKNRHFIFKKVR